MAKKERDKALRKAYQRGLAHGREQVFDGMPLEDRAEAIWREVYNQWRGSSPTLSQVFVFALSHVLDEVKAKLVKATLPEGHSVEKERE